MWLKELVKEVLSETKGTKSMSKIDTLYRRKTVMHSIVSLMLYIYMRATKQKTIVTYGRGDTNEI